jgi:two-component system, chemotaxis family, protein-glutamate methylesterase/glutaminase
MPRDHRLTQSADGASGFVCPRCGGAIWEHDDSGSGSFECRIGDRFSEAEMWIAHSVARNRALLAASRALAEHAALARQLAGSAERRGDIGVAARLQEEASEEDRLYAQVRAMTEGLSEHDLDGTA